MPGDDDLLAILNPIQQTAERILRFKGTDLQHNFTSQTSLV
jgi:hypothetical protein